MATAKYIENTSRKLARRQKKQAARQGTKQPKVKAKYLRCGHIIRELHEDGTHTDTHYFDPTREHIPSNSAAKRKSRELQGTTLGSGVLKLVPKLPKA